jgi:SAM-dependent methyltransferase
MRSLCEDTHVNVVSKLRELLSDRGLTGTMRHLLRRTATELARYRPSQLHDRRVRALKEARFDSEFAGVTGGDARLSRLSIASANRRFGVDYRGVDPEEFARGFSQLAIRHEEFTFIDLGSGKGRALLLAAKFPFRRLIGVEFARELHEIAAANVLHYRNPDGKQPQFQLHCMDATEFDFPREPSVVFLYNPFGPEVIARIAQRLLDSYAADPRPVFVLYINPFHLGPWQALGFRSATSGDPFVILIPPQPDSFERLNGGSE